MSRLIVPLLLLTLAAGCVFTGPPGAVDWRAARVVALESDDWGLCGFVPCDRPVTPADRAALRTGRVPAVYWDSTLEDSAAVAALADLLAARRGRDGAPAVLQANYILGWWRLAPGDRWEAGLLPALPPAYARPGLWTAVRRAVDRGVWRPGYHGLWHYDPARRRDAVARDSLARRLARRGVLPFPGMQRAWELAPWRPDSSVARELREGVTAFRRLFGFPPVSVIAPDYVWSRRHERLWARAGFAAVQAKREQRRPGAGPGARWRKWLERSRRRITEHRLVYLERNARLETAQHGNAPSVLTKCLAAVRRAWRRGEPAVVECHRVNLVSCRPEAARQGRAALAALLDSLAADRPLYATDGELAQLARRGCSARRTGDGWLLRNLAHGARLVVLPAGDGARRVVFLAPGEMRRYGAKMSN